MEENGDAEEEAVDGDVKRGITYEVSCDVSYQGFY